MIPTNKQFLFFLLDTPTGRAYYRDVTGTVKSLVITAGSDISLANAPLNWLDIELSFIRNAFYHATNRSFSTPMEFVRDAVVMVKELFLLGVGTEVPLSIAIFKYNSQPLAGEPTYKLYYKGNLDLPKISEQVLESLTVNLMEGGVLQLLKSYENTVLEIPCDGSIPENQKINCDGLLVPDVFYYQVTPVNDIYEMDEYSSLSTPLSATFVTDEGDNYGIIHSDPEFNFFPSAEFDDTIIPNTSKSSIDFIFMSVSPIQVRIKGQLIIRFNKPDVLFQLWMATSSGQYLPLSGKIAAFSGRQPIINFDMTVNLAENEKMFIWIQINYTPYGGVTGHNILDILDGSFSLSFNSMAKGTRVWAITMYDLFKLILKQICLLASTTFQPLNYEATSDLLQQNLNLFITSGDALRASGDATYQRYYSITEQNQILQTTFGPVIKISLRDFFEAVEVGLVACLGNSHNGTQETLFIESLETVYDSSSVNFSIGEVASLKWNFASDLAFSDLEIGYAPQTYDQQAGKYEYNTTLVMKAPVKSFQNKLSKISKIRWDSYGIERLRSNVGTPTSTTRNDSDNSVFGLNADTSNWVYDYFKAYFQSQVIDPDDDLNTNILLQQSVSSQQITLPTIDGEYFQSNIDQAIFVFSVLGYAAIENCNITITGYVNENNRPPLAPHDTFTFKLWHNGAVIFTSVTTVSGINTSIGFSHDFVETFNYKDCVYATLQTSTTGEAQVTSATLNIGIPTNYISVSAANIPVLSGTAQKLLSWSGYAPTSKPYISSSVVNYGFQYFVFNSLVPNTNFTLGLGLMGYIWNQVGANFQVDIYINGVIQASNIVVTSINGPITPIAPAQFVANLVNQISRNYTLNDIVFITGSVLGTNLNVEISQTTIIFTSNYIKAYSLKRVQYDYLKGIPNLATDSSGNSRTDVPGAPYNIEDLTPKTLYKKWQNYFMSTFMDKVNNQMLFQTLSKNEYLARSYNGVEIVENQNENVLGFDRMFYPIEIEIGTNVPIGFAELMSSTINSHIHCTFMGNDIYFFPNSLTQKPALNESQVWKGILSPKTDLKIFSSINAFKLPDMADNSISCAYASPVQFVPLIQSLPEKYHTRNRNTFLFVDQIGKWSNTHNYTQPVQIGDIIPLQFITRGLDPVYYTVYNCKGIYNGLNLINLTTISSPAIQDPYVLWQTEIDTSVWDEDNYYIIITAGVGVIAAQMISELLGVKPSYKMEDTVLIEYSNSFNSQGLVFDGNIPYVGAMRIKGGYDNLFKQKYLGKFYVDQPQDITVLNAIPYEITELIIGFDEGTPDYVPKKVLRMLLMDGCMLDGEGYSLNDGADIEQVFTQGAPMKYNKVEIRPTKNDVSLNVVASGVDTDSSLIVSVNPQSFGPNITNASGTTETDLINIQTN